MISGRYGVRKSRQAGELARLSALVDKMESELALQKQSLEHKIETLEQDLAQARRLAQTALEQRQEEDRPTSRRRMLKRLGAAAAGLAVAGVAAGVTSPSTAEAAAAPLQGNISLPADGGPDGTVNTVVGTTTIQNSNSNTGMVLQVKNLFSTPTAGTASNPNPNDAIVAVSAAGVAVNANTKSGTATPAIQGIQATDPTALLTDLGTQVTGAGAGVQGAGDTASGVVGASSRGIGVYGFSNNNYGVVCKLGSTSGSAPLFIVPATVAGAPTGGSHTPGEIYVDSAAGYWICTAAGSFLAISPTAARQRHPNASADDIQRMVSGAPPQFEKLLTGAATSGVRYLNTPIRLVGTPNRTYNSPPSFPTIAGGTIAFYRVTGFTIFNDINATTTISDIIPDAAVGVIGTLSAVNPSAAGFMTIFPANATRPEIASISYNMGGVISNLFSVKLGPIPSGPDAGRLGIGVFSLVTSQVAVDLVAYTT